MTILESDYFQFSVWTELAQWFALPYRFAMWDFEVVQGGKEYEHTSVIIN